MDYADFECAVFTVALYEHLVSRSKTSLCPMSSVCHDSSIQPCSAEGASLQALLMPVSIDCKNDDDHGTLYNTL